MQGWGGLIFTRFWFIPEANNKFHKSTTICGGNVRSYYQLTNSKHCASSAATTEYTTTTALREPQADADNVSQQEHQSTKSQRRLAFTRHPSRHTFSEPLLAAAATALDIWRPDSNWFFNSNGGRSTGGAEGEDGHVTRGGRVQVAGEPARSDVSGARGGAILTDGQRRSKLQPTLKLNTTSDNWHYYIRLDIHTFFPFQ